MRDQSRRITLFESGTARNQALSQCNLVMIIMCKTNHAISSMDSVLTQENLNDCTAITLRWFMSVAVPSSHDLCDLSSHDASHSGRARNVTRRYRNVILRTILIIMCETNHDASHYLDSDVIAHDDNYVQDQSRRITLFLLWSLY